MKHNFGKYTKFIIAFLLILLLLTCYKTEEELDEATFSSLAEIPPPEMLYPADGQSITEQYPHITWERPDYAEKFDFELYNLTTSTVHTTQTDYEGTTYIVPAGDP